MRRIVLIAAMLVWTGSERIEASTIYNVNDYQAVQNGYSLLGTIQVSDTAAVDGYLLESEIEAWEFTIKSVSDGSVAASLSSLEPNGIFVLDVLIDSSTIRLPEGFSQFVFGWDTGVPIVNWFRFIDIGANEGYLAYTETSQNLWNYVTPGPNDLGGDPWVIATVEPVPEPTTLAIWSLLGGIGLVAGHRRRKRQAA